MSRENHHEDLVKALNELVLEPSNPEKAKAITNNPISLVIHNLRHSENLISQLQDVLDEKTKSDSLDGISEISLLAQESFSETEKTGSAIITLRNEENADAYLKCLSSATSITCTDLPLSVMRFDNESQDGKKSHKRYDTIRESRSFGKYGHGDSFEPSSMNSSRHSPKKSISNENGEVIYDAIVIENLGQIFSQPISLGLVQEILSKFSLFGPLDAAFLPIESENGAKYKLEKAGFIGFAHENNFSENLLRCFYHLDGLTIKQLFDFTKTDIHEVSLHGPASTNDLEGPYLKLSLCQQKHSRLLVENGLQAFIAFDHHDKPSVCDLVEQKEVYERQVKRFSKAVNYQETNVYVNNLAVLFQNDDIAWYKFWNQFGEGGIKSAKIIKPQFYSKRHDDSSGRFGFVFYRDVQMALRAILLTNNKTVKFKDHPGFKIEASFAIQKDTHAKHQSQLNFISPWHKPHIFEGSMNRAWPDGQRSSSPAILGGNYQNRQGHPVQAVPVYAPGYHGNNAYSSHIENVRFLPFHENYLMGPYNSGPSPPNYNFMYGHAASFMPARRLSEGQYVPTWMNTPSSRHNEFSFFNPYSYPGPTLYSNSSPSSDLVDETRPSSREDVSKTTNDTINEDSSEKTGS
ncbi:hypothetical protein OXX80_005546 [Metschnikowia pulcherrima]